MTKRATLYDQSDSFGWISIALHWSTALIVIALWIIGRSIEFQVAEAVDARRSLHVSLGLIAWLLLAARILWRIKQPHPKAVGQSQLIHNIARLAHYLMLALLGVMLVSGPIMAWTLTIQPGIANPVHAIHASAANLLAILVVLHVGGTLKHLMFNDDETIARIFLPRR